MPGSNDKSKIEPDELYCHKCGQHWGVHNDDGSCVDDEEEKAEYDPKKRERVLKEQVERLEKDKELCMRVAKGSPLKWAMEELKKHLDTSMDIKTIIESLRIDINEYGNIELIIEMTPEIAIIVGESIMFAGRRPDFMKELDDDSKFMNLWAIWFFGNPMEK